MLLFNNEQPIMVSIETSRIRTCGIKDNYMKQNCVPLRQHDFSLTSLEESNMSCFCNEKEFDIASQAGTHCKSRHICQKMTYITSRRFFSYKQRFKLSAKSYSHSQMRIKSIYTINDLSIKREKIFTVFLHWVLLHYCCGYWLKRLTLFY